MAPSDILLKKLQYHSPLDAQDVAVVRRLPCELRELAVGEDFLRQGDRPHASAIVMEGMVARYHTLRSGRRQYISLHLPGDWPDAQGLFLTHMDHSVCAAGEAVVCAISHAQLMKAFRARPNLCFAVWRETLIDAAIFREAVTNNSSRAGAARLAHFFCEIFYRAKQVGLVSGGACPLPLSQTQLGEMLGMSLVSVNRHMKALRKTRSADHRSGRLVIHNWARLATLGEFDPDYLHQTIHGKK